MASNNILRVSDVDIDSLTMGTPKSLDNGGKMISLMHKNKPFIIQIPSMESPYGLSRYVSDRGGDDKISLDLSFKNAPELLEMFTKLDAKLISEGFKNGMPWFKKKFANEDVVEALYTHLVKHSKDKETGEITDKYPPTLKISVPYKEGKYLCEVYDNKKNSVPMEGLELKGANVTAIIQCNGVWVAGGKFGCKFKLLQMKVNSTPYSSKITGYAFLDDEDRLTNEDE